MKKIFTLLAFGTLITGLFAQQLPLYNQYHINPFLYNPSQAGIKDGINANLIHKSQWLDLAGAPETSILTIDAPFSEKNIGLGFTIFSDKTDIFSRTGAYSAYSYKINVNDEHVVHAGLSAGILNNRVNFSNAIVRDVSDPFLLNGMPVRTTFDATLGATYIWKDLEVGLAVPHLLGQKEKLMQSDAVSVFQYRQHLLTSLKYTFNVNEEKGMTAYPLVLIRAAQGTPIQYDVNAVFDWKNIGWAAVTYRSHYAIGINLGVRINNSLRAGYAYDLSINRMGGYLGGSHELLLGFTFGKGGRSTSSDDYADSDLPSSEFSNDELESLRKNLAHHRNEINALKEEINKLKLSSASNLSKASVGGADGVKTESSENYSDEQGANISVGHYVVIGSFQKQANAEKAVKLFEGEGFDIKTMFNKESGYTYVYVAKSNDINEATDILKSARDIVPDAWILYLK
jgi:type IX secretion system PorP/SprF family membrane protein